MSVRPATRILILPGWQNSGPDHWQTRWERLYGYQRVEQHDWMRPLRGDWIAQLEDVLLADEAPAALVAHSLGCIQVAAWAAHSRNTGRVRAALLVAPPEVEREDLRQQLPGWAPACMQPAVAVSLDRGGEHRRPIRRF
jgi:predicted alpha/beta hydrolase family esterase